MVPGFCRVAYYLTRTDLTLTAQLAPTNSILKERACWLGGRALRAAGPAVAAADGRPTQPQMPAFKFSSRTRGGTDPAERSPAVGLPSATPVPQRGSSRSEDPAGQRTGRDPGPLPPSRPRTALKFHWQSAPPHDLRLCDVRRLRCPPLP